MTRVLKAGLPAQNSVFFAPESYSWRLGDRLHPHDAKTLAHALMALHGLSGWSFHFDHARRRLDRAGIGPGASRSRGR